MASNEEIFHVVDDLVDEFSLTAISKSKLDTVALFLHREKKLSVEDIEDILSGVIGAIEFKGDR